MDVETLRKVARAIRDSGSGFDQFEEVYAAISGDCPSDHGLKDSVSIGACLKGRRCLPCWLIALGLKEAE